MSTSIHGFGKNYFSQTVTRLVEKTMNFDNNDFSAFERAMKLTFEKMRKLIRNV